MKMFQKYNLHEIYKAIIYSKGEWKSTVVSDKLWRMLQIITVWQTLLGCRTTTLHSKHLNQLFKMLKVRSTTAHVWIYAWYITLFSIIWSLFDELLLPRWLENIQNMLASEASQLQAKFNLLRTFRGQKQRSDFALKRMTMTSSKYSKYTIWNLPFVLRILKPVTRCHVTNESWK